MEVSQNPQKFRVVVWHGRTGLTQVSGTGINPFTTGFRFGDKNTSKWYREGFGGSEGVKALQRTSRKFSAGGTINILLQVFGTDTEFEIISYPFVFLPGICNR